MKRLAARASLQRPYNQQIMTPRQLYNWAHDNIPAIFFHYCSIEEYKAEEQFLQDRFARACTIAGTRKPHFFIPSSESTLLTKQYSNSPSYREVKIIAEVSGHHTLESINGFITCVLI